MTAQAPDAPLQGRNPLAASGPVRAWLFCVWVMIFAMVIIGGITRLTGSGLSMVEWHPLMGALPPMNEADWLVVWEKYQLSPQYQQVNNWMELADFKRIFFWEYFHRLIGRLIGLVFFVPWAWFLARRSMSAAVAKRSALAFVLGGAQGLLGWYMVKSGLVDRPEVSHLRLAAHLLLAFLVGVWVFWLWRATGPEEAAPEPTAEMNRLRRGAWLVMLLTFVQSAWGAFMAGTRAGVVAPTFPDMNGGFLPPGLTWAEVFSSASVNAPLAIHFTHRLIAYVLAIVALAWAFQVWRRAATATQRKVGLALAAVVVLQVTLGALTVLQHVAIPLAVAHQGVAFVMLSVLAWGLAELR